VVDDCGSLRFESLFRNVFSQLRIARVGNVRRRDSPRKMEKPYDH
jgi:hypothetical protein